jgi:hypothetical protein
VDEFKGRRAAVRGSVSIMVDPARLRLLTSCSAGHVSAQSSGSRGASTGAAYDLAHIRERAVNVLLVLDALDGVDWLHATWGVPGGGAMIHLLDYAALGAPPVRWFSQVDPSTPGLHPGQLWGARAICWWSVLAGVRLPTPRHVPLEGALPIARWMADVLRTGEIPHLQTYVSSAVRVCRQALDAGIDIRGARFTVGGEPITAARLATIGEAGAEAVQRYATAEASHIGYGCLAPNAADDQHLLYDFNALIQADSGQERPDLPPGALLLSSLRATAPLMLLNVSMGDRAEVVERACGCPLERLGWTTHLHSIRSFEKLNAGGMTFLDADIIRVLEEVLPARFGGGPTDYQLLEEEADDGRPCVRLLVHPKLGPLDARAVAEAFLARIGPGRGAKRVMALQWRAAGLPRVERRAPLATGSGKILHLHQG